jgi:hypothetical protein
VPLSLFLQPENTDSDKISAIVSAEIFLIIMKILSFVDIAPPTKPCRQHLIGEATKKCTISLYFNIVIDL